MYLSKTKQGKLNNFLVYIIDLYQFFFPAHLIKISKREMNFGSDFFLDLEN